MTEKKKHETISITNPICQICAKRHTCNNKTFVFCYVPENMTINKLTGNVILKINELTNERKKYL